MQSWDGGNKFLKVSLPQIISVIYLKMSFKKDLFIGLMLFMIGVQTTKTYEWVENNQTGTVNYFCLATSKEGMTPAKLLDFIQHSLNILKYVTGYNLIPALFKFCNFP